MNNTMIQVIHENAFFIVLQKPIGVSVHNESPSLLEWLKLQNKSQNFVNRLDQQTSGLVLIAKNPDDQEGLQQSLAEGQKIYRALLRTGWKSEALQATWSWPLTDKAEGRKNPQGLAGDRKPCLTLAAVVRTNQYFTEVLCEIKTGRQHQIRKHAALAKHPIVGDSRYNDENYNLKMASFYKTTRLFLNAEKMIFSFKNEKYAFESETLNCDLFLLNKSQI